MANLTDHIEVIGLLTENCEYVQLQHYKVYQRALRKWVGADVVITIRPLKYKRSDAQNRYMWGMVVKYVREWFYETEGKKLTPDEVYTWLRIGLLGEKPKIVEVAGERVVTMVGKRFSQMTTAEFAEATDTILRQMAERGCHIPEPSKKGTNFYHELVDE